MSKETASDVWLKAAKKLRRLGDERLARLFEEYAGKSLPGGDLTANDTG